MNNLKRFKDNARQILSINNTLYGYSFLFIVAMVFLSLLQLPSFLVSIISLFFEIEFIIICMKHYNHSTNNLFESEKLIKGFSTFIWIMIYCYKGILVFLFGLIGFIFSLGQLFYVNVLNNFNTLYNFAEGTTIFSVLLMIIGIVLYCYDYYSYGLSLYMSLDDDLFKDLSAKECVKKSKELMEGNKMNLFTLDLSFIPWFLLSILTCGLLYIYVYPYYFLSLIDFYNKIPKNKILYDKNVDNIDIKSDDLIKEKEDLGNIDEMKNNDDFKNNL